MKMTLLEWEKQGYPGVFFIGEDPDGLLVWHDKVGIWAQLQVGGNLVPGSTMLFVTMRLLSLYLRRGPSEIEGEVRS